LTLYTKSTILVEYRQKENRMRFNLKNAEDKGQDGSKGDAQQSGPPNLRQAMLGEPSCMSCQYYQQVLGQCQKYGTRTLPNQVCDDWDGGTAPDLGGGGPKLTMPKMAKSGSAMQQPAQSGIAPVQKLTPLPGVGGQKPQPRPPQPGQPNFQGMQPNPQAWRPSAVAQVASAKGDPNAWIMNLFKPQQQQQQQQPQQQPQMPAKHACVLSNMFIREMTKRAAAPLLTQKLPVHSPSTATSTFPTKSAAVHALGDPLPKDWNKTLSEPTKTNGGITSHGREAWDSVKGYKRKESDKDNFDLAWHTPKAKKAEAKPADCICPDYPRTVLRNGSGHHPACPVHQRWQAAGGFKRKTR
jgi:hypothetical protein